MSRILLVDDSPHAQRMGERILSEEGFEVVTVSNADSALIRLDDVAPDVVIADTVMPGRTGYDVCHYLKLSPRHRHVKVILTAGVLEALDEEQCKRVEADATLKKPFEASALIGAVQPLAAAAAEARAQQSAAPESGPAPAAARTAAVPFIAVVDAEQVRAAVTVALDASMEKIVDEIASRVLAALNAKKSPAHVLEARIPDLRALETRLPELRFPEPRLPEPRPPEPIPAPPPPAVMKMAPPEPLAPPEPSRAAEAQPSSPLPSGSRIEPVRRVTPLRLRSGSILGLDMERLPSEPSEELPPPE